MVSVAGRLVSAFTSHGGHGSDHGGGIFGRMGIW